MLYTKQYLKKRIHTKLFKLHCQLSNENGQAKFKKRHNGQKYLLQSYFIPKSFVSGKSAIKLFHG